MSLLKIKSICLFALVVPSVSSAANLSLYVDLGLKLGGEELIEYRNASCSIFERSFGCHSGKSSISAGDGWEISLGGIYKIQTIPLHIRLSHSINYAGTSVDDDGEIRYKHPHTDIALEYPISSHRLAFGISRYEKTKLDLSDWNPATSYNGEKISFEDTFGWFVEYKFMEEGNVGFGFRKGFVDFKIDKIDGINVSNGENIRADYGELFMVFEF